MMSIHHFDSNAKAKKPLKLEISNFKDFAHTLFHAVSNRLFSCVRQQSNDSCSLDSSCYLSLMNSASSCDSLRKDLSSLCHILLELFNVFVIYSFSFISAELAHFFSSHAATSFIIHDIISFLLERDIIILECLKSFRYAHVSIGRALIRWLRALISAAAA